MNIKKTLIIILGLVIALPICAEENPFKSKKSISAYIGGQTRKQINAPEGIPSVYHSDINVGLQTNFMHIKLHKGVIENLFCVKFDIGVDLSYALYERLPSVLNQKHDIDWRSHQAEIGLDLGPSVHFAPFEDVREVQFMTYYHFIPSASAHIEDTNVYAAFCPMQSVGLSASWKFVGVGYEHRWGSAKYTTYDIESKDEGVQKQDEKSKFKTTSHRFFLRFNF